MGGTLPELLHVSDRRIQSPAEAPVKVGDGHGRRAADAGSAVQIDRMAGRESQSKVRTHSGTFSRRLMGSFLLYGDPPELNAREFVVSFERFPREISGTHIIVSLQIEHGRDTRFPLKFINVMNGLGMRANEELGKNLCVVHALAAERFDWLDQIACPNFSRLMIAVAGD